jgi:ABC-2 type transport system permease protein
VVTNSSTADRGQATAGGLFSTGGDLPHAVAVVSPWLPTRQWSDLLLKYGLEGDVPLRSGLALGAYGIGFAVVAAWGYRRDEARQFR